MNRGPLFVVGNGPSLNDTPLDLIAGRESWAMNRIHLLYPRTAWRPTKWLWCDRTNQKTALLMEEAVTVHFKEGYECYVWDGLRDLMDWKYENDIYGPHIFYPPMCAAHSSMDYFNPGKPERWHVDFPRDYPFREFMNSGQLCKWGSGLFSWVQAGVWAGYGPIFVVGCDLYVERDETTDPNHFDPRYDTSWSKYNPWQDPFRKNKTLVRGHELCRAMADEYGTTILNATVGGQLEVYPRVSFEEAARCQ